MMRPLKHALLVTGLATTCPLTSNAAPEGAEPEPESNPKWDAKPGSPVVVPLAGGLSVGFAGTFVRVV
jgi:hypothetical protein